MLPHTRTNAPPRLQEGLQVHPGETNNKAPPVDYEEIRDLPVAPRGREVRPCRSLLAIAHALTFVHSEKVFAIAAGD